MASRRNVSTLPIMAAWVAVLFSSQCHHQVAANGFPRDVVEDEDLHFDINSSKPQIRHYGKIHTGSTMVKVTKFQSESDEGEENIQKRLVAYDLDPILPPYDKVYEQLVVKLEERAKDEDENETSTFEEEEEEEETFGDPSVVEGQIDAASSGNTDKEAEEIDKQEVAGIVETTNDMILEEREPMEIQVDDEHSEEGDSIEKSTDDVNDTNVNDTSEGIIAEENEGDVLTIIDEELEEVESSQGVTESSEEGIITKSEPLISSEPKTDAGESIDESSTSEESSEDPVIETQESVLESKESSDDQVSADESSIDAEEKEESEEILDTVIEEELGSGEATDTSDVEKSEEYQQEETIEAIVDPAIAFPESDTNGSEEPSTDDEVVVDAVETVDSNDSNVEEVAMSETSTIEEGRAQQKEDPVDPISSIVEEDLVSLETGYETGAGDNEEEEEVAVEEKEIAADESTDDTIIVEDNTMELVDIETSVFNEEIQEAERVDHDTDTDIEAIETDTYDSSADNIDSNEGKDTPVVVDANAEEPVEESDQITSPSDLEEAEDENVNADTEQHEEEIIGDGLEQSEEEEIDGNAFNSEEVVIDMDVQQSDEDSPDAVDPAETVDPDSLVDRTSEEEVEATEVAEAQSDNSEAPTENESVNDEEPALDESDVEEPTSTSAIHEEEPAEEFVSEEVTGTPASVDSESGQDELSEDSQDLEDASTIIDDDATIQDAGNTDDTEKEQNEQEPQQILSIPKPTANEQFVKGLDDLHKIFEEVDPPDELDVGASGLSMEEVFKQQGVTIIKMRVQKGVEQVKKSLATLKKNGRKQWSNFKEALDEKFDFNVDEMAVSVVEKLEEPYQKGKDFFSENRGKFDGLTKAIDKVVSKAKTILSRIGIIDSDDDYDYDEEDDDLSFEGLQINDDDLAEMRKKLLERYS